MNRPASLWFWRDWESDMALKACSLAAQGLWMRMLCIAAQHDPTGYVSINSVGLSAEGIARIVGVGVQECERLIGELSLNGVFARDRTGTIYNRRMVRDAKKALVARKNGKLGGNPILTCRTQTPHPGDHELPKSPPDVTISKISEIPASDKGQDKDDHKALDKLKPLPKPKNKDSFYQNAARDGPPPSPARGSRLAATPKRRKGQRLADERELEKLKEKYSRPVTVSGELRAKLEAK